MNQTTIKQRIGEMDRKARSAVSTATESAKSMLEHSYQNIDERISAIEDANLALVKRHPGKALAAVALTGLAIGYLISQRSPR